MEVSTLPPPFLHKLPPQPRPRPPSAPLPFPLKRAPLPGPNSVCKPGSSDLPSKETILPYSGPPKGAAEALHGASGDGSPQKASNGRPLPLDETTEKAKQKRVRKSRASGTPRKRVKANPVLDANLDTNAIPTTEVPVAPAKRRRANAKTTSTSDNPEKPPPRRRNRQAANKRRTKEAQALLSPNNESAFSTTYSRSSKGILGIYGLNMQAVDLTRYMKEIPLEDLISGDIQAVSPPCRQDFPPPSVPDSSFGQHVSSILEVLAKPSNAEISQPGCASVSANQTECKQQKLMLDLEIPPQADDEEGPCSVDDKGLEPCSHSRDGTGAHVPENRNPLGAPYLFPIETLPLVPLTEFWSTLQLQPMESLECLLAQATGSTETRAGNRAVPSDHKAESLLPLPFSLNSIHALHENRYSKLNYWFRAGSPKRECSETCFVQLASASPETTVPSKVDGASDAGRPGRKLSLMDIDLNRQSPEAEAANTLEHASSVTSLKSGTVPVSVSTDQVKMETNEVKPPTACQKEQWEDRLTCTKQKDSIYTDVNKFKDHEDKVACTKPVDCICSDVNKITDHEPVLLQKNVVKEELVQELYSANVNSEGRQCEPQNNLPSNASPHLPVLSFPSHSPDLWNDVPCSPGVQAAAHLLCKMANSLSPFYIDKDDKQPSPSDNDLPAQRLSKVARIGDRNNTGGRICKSVPNQEKWEDRLSLKVQAGEGKKKLLSQVRNGNLSRAEKPCAQAQYQEKSSTPSRSVSKSILTRLSGSSDSDKSPERSTREDIRITSKEVHGKANRIQIFHPVGSIKVSNSSIKESRELHRTVSKVNSALCPIPRKGTLFFEQRKLTTVCETEQSIYGEGLTKASRPRSNSARNRTSPHRNVSNYLVKPSHVAGCSVKSARQIVPLVGEVRQGTKRLL